MVRFFPWLAEGTVFFEPGLGSGFGVNTLRLLCADKLKD